MMMQQTSLQFLEVSNLPNPFSKDGLDPIALNLAIEQRPRRGQYLRYTERVEVGMDALLRIELLLLLLDLKSKDKR